MYVRYVWVSWGCLIEPSEFCSDTDPDAAALTFEGGCLSEWCGDDALMLAYICIVFICQTETQLLRGWGTGCARRSWRVDHIWASANPKDSACSTFFVSCTASCNLKSLSGSILHKSCQRAALHRVWRAFTPMLFSSFCLKQEILNLACAIGT